MEGYPRSFTPGEGNKIGNHRKLDYASMLTTAMKDTFTLMYSRLYMFQTGEIKRELLYETKHICNLFPMQQLMHYTNLPSISLI